MYRVWRHMIRRINGADIHYETMGETGNRVLLLHGWGCDISLMKPVGEALQAEHRVMMVDFPGHGESGRPPEPWGVPEFAETLVILLRETGFFPCSVVAHSFGCRIAAWIASHETGLFEKMVFTGGAGIRPKPSEEAEKRQAHYKKLRNQAEKIRKIPFLRTAADSVEERLRRKYGSRDYNALDAEMRQTFVRVVSQDLTDCYADIPQSTLLIWGDQDTETPLWMAHEMEKRIPDCGLVIFEGGTHFAYLEQISRFNLIISGFLKEA